MCVCVCLHVQPSPVWTAEVRPSEGGGLHQKEAAPGLPAVLLRPQRSAVSQESSYAGTNARLHAGTGTGRLWAHSSVLVKSSVGLMEFI